MRFDGLDTDEARRERERVAAGELPARYGEPWGRPFFTAARAALRPGVRILDVGSGRDPILPVEVRPPGVTYVGLDISEAELAAAPAGVYDETIVADISVGLPRGIEAFDLVLSWQVLEHVSSMENALDNIRECLRSGGQFVALLSGSRAAYALLGRFVPYHLADAMMRRLLGTEEGEKFPTHYDKCTAAELEPLLSRWSEHQIIPRYKAGGYFRFFRPVERAYIRYENWIERTGRCQLATHYVISAVR